MEDCIFCKIAKNELPSFKVWENEKYVAFLDIRPIKKGHLLLIPKAHFSYLFDMPQTEYVELLKIAKTLSHPLKSFFNAKKIGMLVEGLAVDHVHIHLIPINKIGELNPAKGKPADMDELKELAQQLSKHFSNFLEH